MRFAALHRKRFNDCAGAHHEQRCGNALAGNVGDQKREFVGTDAEEIVEVAADLLCRTRFRAEVERMKQFGKRREHAGKNVALNLRRQFEFALNALPLRPFPRGTFHILLKIVRHLVEGLRQKPYLVLPVFRHSHGETSLSEPHGLADQLFDRGVDETRNHPVRAVKHHQGEDDVERNENHIAEFNQRKHLVRGDLHGKDHAVVETARKHVELLPANPEPFLEDFGLRGVRDTGIPRQRFQRTSGHGASLRGKHGVRQNASVFRRAQENE